MRRGLIGFVIALGCAAPAAASTSPAPPRASLQDFVCQQSTNHWDRAIQVVAVMRAVPDTERMRMKFVLLRRSASGSLFTPVEQGDLGQWHRAKAGVTTWRRTQTVANLAASSVYRFRVSFRWLGASGTLLKHTVLFSSLCSQPQ